MKFLFIITFIFSFNTFAEAKKENDFEKNKAETLKQIDGKIANITLSRNCVASAKDINDLKACRTNLKSKLEELRGKRKAKHTKK